MEDPNQKKPVLPIGFTAALILVGLLISFLSFFFIKKIILSDKHLVPIGILTLIIGLIYEYKRICQKWTTVILTTVISYGASFWVFIDKQGRTGYDLDSRIEAWPYVFCFFFIFITIFFHEKKTTPAASEGITLLQSIAITYWAIDMKVYNISEWYVYCLEVIGILFVLYSLFHAFTYKKLHSKSRLRLSIWSSFVMMVFSIENIYSLYSNQTLIESSNNTFEAIIVAIQYFFLGISAVYLAQNLLMLLRFIPGTRTFFNKFYFQDIKDLKKQHVLRYSNEQINPLHALISLIVTSVLFILNYNFNWFPRNFIIWAVFVLLPLLIHLFIKITYKPKIKPKHIIFRKDKDNLKNETW